MPARKLLTDSESDIHALAATEAQSLLATTINRIRSGMVATSNPPFYLQGNTHDNSELRGDAASVAALGKWGRSD